MNYDEFKGEVRKIINKYVNNEYDELFEKTRTGEIWFVDWRTKYRAERITDDLINEKFWPQFKSREEIADKVKGWVEEYLPRLDFSENGKDPTDEDFNKAQDKIASKIAWYSWFKENREILEKRNLKDKQDEEDEF